MPRGWPPQLEFVTTDIHTLQDCAELLPERLRQHTVHPSQDNHSQRNDSSHPELLLNLNHPNGDKYNNTGIVNGDAGNAAIDHSYITTQHLVCNSPGSMPQHMQKYHHYNPINDVRYSETNKYTTSAVFHFTDASSDSSNSVENLYIGNDDIACGKHGVIDSTIIKTCVRVAPSFIHPHPPVVTLQQRQKLQIPIPEFIKKSI